MLDQTNATLLAVASSSSGEAYDGGEVPGPQKWAAPLGQRPNAYLRLKRDRRMTAGGEERSIDRRLIVATDEPDIDWKSGDYVTFEYQGDVSQAKVKLVEIARVDDPDIVPELQTTRLTLEAA